MIFERAKKLIFAILMFMTVGTVVNIFSPKSQEYLKHPLSRSVSVEELCYGVIFDAGSSSTKLGVYSWQCRDMISLPNFNPVSVFKDKILPGLSTFAQNLTAIDGYLRPLLDKIKTVIPEQKYSVTPVMLGATAGMRLLSL